MKRISTLFMGLLLLILLTSCAFDQGKSANAKETFGQSEKFAKKEISAAMAEVKKEFKTYKSCELTSIWYDEARSDDEISSYLVSGRGAENGAKAENVIVLLSDYKTGSNTASGFNPNSEYTDWMWILIRDSETGRWRVDDCGY